MSGAIDGIRTASPQEGTTAKMEQASSLFAPEDETNGDVEMINIGHKVSSLDMGCLSSVFSHFADSITRKPLDYGKTRERS